MACIITCPGHHKNDKDDEDDENDENDEGGEDDENGEDEENDKLVDIWGEGGRDLVEISSRSRGVESRSGRDLIIHRLYIIKFKMLVCNPQPRILTLVSKPGRQHPKISLR